MGARVEIEGVTHEVRAARGVVLACGGYPHDVARRAQTFAYTPSGREHWSAAPLANTGDGIRMGEAIGAHFDASLETPAAWAPVSLVPKGKGKPEVAFPHLIERAKPGVIAVTRGGQALRQRGVVVSRLHERADRHHPSRRRSVRVARLRSSFSAALWARFLEAVSVSHRALSTLWLSEAREHVCRNSPRNAASIRKGSRSTVAAYNSYAKDGFDPQFHKGSTPYNRVQGDARHTPNPCLAPIVDGPFHAVKLLPGSLGTFAGLATDATLARARPDAGADSRPLRGRQRRASMMGGCYPSGGITLGPAMTFGYLAGTRAR